MRDLRDEITEPGNKSTGIAYGRTVFGSMRPEFLISRRLNRLVSGEEHLDHSGLKRNIG
jgi:hypothetical protein